MNVEIQNRVPLKEWSWWKAGGEAECFCLPKNLQELKESVQWAKKNQKPITVLSGGTNVLISDQGVPGLVIALKNLRGIQQIQEESAPSERKTNDSAEHHENKYFSIQALAGTPKHELFKVFSKEKLAPALFLCGLPGDAGGGVVMNAGVSNSVFPKEFSQMICRVQVLSLEENKLKIFKKEDLQWGYRSCRGWRPGIIYKAEFQWPWIPVENFSQKLKEINKKRIRTQPLNRPSCGSVFKNPPNEKSGRLIEQSGLKGFSIGSAEVSKKHANFIVNTGAASAQEIHQVIAFVQKKVQKDSGIVLEPEVHYLGFWDF